MATRELIEILACPDCGAANLEFGEDALRCPTCDASYPILNGVAQMLPSHLANALKQKSAYMERLRASMLKGGESPPADPEVDRFMWEQQLYSWGKEVIYRDARAAQVFSSYAEGGAKTLCQFIKEKATELKHKRLLYVGSGNDRQVTLPLEQAGAFVVNLDIASEPLEDLVQAGAKNCVCGDFRRLPFPAGAFDVVFSKGSVHHSHPIAEPLTAMARVTKRGGYIIVAEPNRYSLHHLPRYLLLPHLRKKFVRLLPRRPGLGYPTPYEDAISAAEVARILMGEGISHLERRTLTHLPPHVPPAIARVGKAIPWLFDRFAFEFIVCGKKT